MTQQSPADTGPRPAQAAPPVRLAPRRQRPSRRSRSAPDPLASGRELNRGVAVSAGAQMTAKGLHFVLNIISTLAIIHYLDPGAYGQYVLVLTSTMLVGLLADFGLTKLATVESPATSTPSRRCWARCWRPGSRWPSWPWASYRSCCSCWAPQPDRAHGRRHRLADVPRRGGAGRGRGVPRAGAAAVRGVDPGRHGDVREAALVLVLISGAHRCRCCSWRRRWPPASAPSSP